MKRRGIHDVGAAIAMAVRRPRQGEAPHDERRYRAGRGVLGLDEVGALAVERGPDDLVIAIKTTD